MPAKLVLHIGHHKTGSSSIQMSLARNGITIEDKKILYPCAISHNYLSRHFEEYAKSGKIFPGKEGMPGLKTIQDRMRESDWDYVVISGEEFEGSSAKDVQKVLADFFLPNVEDHSVICYVRPHASRILSNFAEKIKIGQFSGTPAQFHKASLERGRFFYAKRMESWVSVFGDHLRMRAMVRSRLHGESVVQDFVREAFGDDAAHARIVDWEDANASLCIEDLMLLKIVQGQVQHREKPVRLMLGWEVARLIGAGMKRKKRTKPALHKSLAEEIRRDYLEDAREMDRLYFPDNPIFEQELEKAVDQALPEAQSYNPKDYFKPEMRSTIRVMSKLVDEMLGNEKGKWGAYLREVRYKAVLSEK